MNLVSLQLSALSALNVSALRAFHPDPENGTLYGPRLENADDANAVACRLITDGEPANELTLFSVLALIEAGQYWRLCSGRDLERPYPLPSADEKGTPWFLEDYRKGDEPGAHGRAVFRTLDPIRIVEADLRMRPHYRFSFTLESAAAQFTQSIRVNELDHSVETDRFSAQIRKIPFENGLKLALGLSTAIYTSEQYDAESALGSLQFRQGELGSWSEVGAEMGANEKKRFVTPLFDPDCHSDLFFASSCSVFEDPMKSGRRPVVSLHLAPASEKTWDLKVSLCRSPTSPQRLMPLAAELRRLLWEPILDRIIKR